MGVHLGYKDDDGNLQDPRGLHIIFMLLNLNNKVRFMVHGYDFIPKDRQNDYCAWRNIKHDGHVKSQLSFHGETVVHPVDRDWAACMMAAAKNLGQPPGDLRSPKNISTFAQEYTPLGTLSRKSGSEYPQTPSRLARRAIFHGGSIGKHTKYGCTPGKTMSPIAESPPPPNMSSPDDFPSLGGGPTSPTHTCRTETNRKSSLGPNRGLGLAPPTFGLAGLSLNDKGFGSSSDPFGGPSKKEPELPKGWKVKNTRR